MELGKRDRLARWLAGDGIEIGALHRPLPVPSGARVRYVDHLPEDKLREHYPELAELPLTPVDLIGSAEDLSAIPDRSVDFVIANHLLEHLEYPIRGLREFQRVLRRGGILYMALPDQRQTFDRDRALTPAEHIFAEEIDSTAAENRLGHYLEWAEKVDGKSAGAQARAHADRLLATGYSIHFHVWRPDTFLDFLVEARRRFNLDFDILAFETAAHQNDDEFILVLARGAGGGLRFPGPGSAASESAAARTPPTSSPTLSNLRSRLAGSPIGPPVRALRKLIRKRAPR